MCWALPQGNWLFRMDLHARKHKEVQVVWLESEQAHGCAKLWGSKLSNCSSVCLRWCWMWRYVSYFLRCCIHLCDFRPASCFEKYGRWKKAQCPHYPAANWCSTSSRLHGVCAKANFCDRGDWDLQVVQNPTQHTLFCDENTRDARSGTFSSGARMKIGGVGWGGAGQKSA